MPQKRESADKLTDQLFQIDPNTVPSVLKIHLKTANHRTNGKIIAVNKLNIARNNSQKENVSHKSSNNQKWEWFIEWRAAKEYWEKVKADIKEKNRVWGKRTVECWLKSVIQCQWEDLNMGKRTLWPGSIVNRLRIITKISSIHKLTKRDILSILNLITKSWPI